MDETKLEKITVLMRMMEAKDTYTVMHSYRVSELAVKIGTQMQFSEPDLENLKYNALLHDVGKLLMKNEVLQSEEFVTNKYAFYGHCKDGVRILRTFGLSEYAVGAMYHHDYYHIEGSSFSNSSEGEDIPLMSRIISVADAYDAMTTDRPYQEAIRHWEACKELEKCAGSQFDPEVVSAVFAVLNRFCVVK